MPYDSTVVLVPQRVRLETPLGAIEADTGSPILDGVMVVSVVLILYVGKKLLDKYFRNKNGS